MSSITLDISDYLSKEEITDLVKDQVRFEIRKLFANEENAKRIISNISYQLIFDEVDKIVPNSRDIIISKVTEVIEQKDFSYEVFHEGIFDKPSLGRKIVQEAVVNNKVLINEKVKETINGHDYSDDIWTKFEELGESFISNIYEIVRLGKEKTSHE